MPCKLSVNLNKIALLRNSRESDYPSVLEFGRLALNCGADGLTVHPRMDGRHIRPKDVLDLSNLIREEFPHAEFNVEGSPDMGNFKFDSELAGNFLELMTMIKPDQCTLVPDSPDQLTSDHGWDARRSAKILESTIQLLKASNIRVSLFVDAGADTGDPIFKTGTDRIEIYTGPYALGYSDEKSREDHLRKIKTTVMAAKNYGLGINAGHDLNLDNLNELLSIGGIEELSIGHAITVDSLHFGFAESIRRYAEIIHRH